MELVIYVTIAWVVTAYMITTTRKDEVIRSIIIYFIFIMLAASSFSIVTLNLQLIHASEEKTKFLSILINRNITAPILTIIFINFFYRLKSYKKVVPIVILMALFSVLEVINLEMKLYSYVNWSFGLVIAEYFLFVLVTLGISKYLNVLQLRGGDK